MRSYFKLYRRYAEANEGETTLAYLARTASHYHWDACPEESAEFFTHDYLAYGDYSGAGSVGKSNVRCLERDFPEGEGFLWARVYGGHGHQCIAIHADYNPRLAHNDYPPPEDFDFDALPDGEGWNEYRTRFAEAVDALDDYPLWDEDDHSDLEFQEEEEAWGRDGYDDLAYAVRKEYGSDEPEDAWLDDFDASHAARLVQAVYHGKAHGDEVVHEQGGCYIDVKRILKRFVTIEAVRDAYHGDEPKDTAGWEGGFAPNH